MKTPLFRFISTLLLIFSLSVQAQDIKIENPWLRAAPPNAPALAVFMTIQNDNEKTISLKQVKGNASLGTIELHRTIVENKIMKMIPQKVIPVAPKSSTVLKPGSWHIMLIKPDKVPKVGESIELTLIFDNGSEQDIVLPVIKGKKMMRDHHSMMKKKHKMMSE